MENANDSVKAEQVNYQISEENRNAIVQYLDSSQLPHNDVKQLVQLLLSLKKVEPEKPKKNKNVDK